MLLRKSNTQILSAEIISAERDASQNVITLGGYSVAKRPKRTGRNPSTGERANPSGTPTMYITGLSTLSRSEDNSRLV